MKHSNIIFSVRRLITVICAAAIIFPFTSCSDYLDVEYLLDDQVDIKEAFENVEYSKRWLAGVYSRLRTPDNWDVCTKEQNTNQFNFISDDMYYTDREKENDMVEGQLASYRIYRGGQYSEKFLQGSWEQCYIGIRDASIYIHNIDRLVNGQNVREAMTDKDLDEYIRETKAEARFLRAYFYWLLLRKYGPIPIMPDEGVDFTASYEELSIPRSRYDVCVEYIASELALAAIDLPSIKDRSNREVLKATKGAALAARAKVYLFGASPQYNGNTGNWASKLVNYDGSPLIDPEYKEERWAKAAAAAKEVIDLGDYRLYTSPIQTSDKDNMHGASGSKLAYDYYSLPKTIAPGKIIVDNGNNGWKLEEQEYPGYDDAPFGDGGPGCGWEDIDPSESYRQVFDGTLPATSNPELIFSRGYGTETSNLAFHQMPRTMGGWNCHGLTLKVFDAYYMADGSDFYRYKKETDENGQLYFFSDPQAEVPEYAKEYTGRNTRVWTNYNDWRPLPVAVSMQNANREPRFYASVAYNGSIWGNEGTSAEEGNRNLQIFTYRNNTKDGKNATGFYYWTGIGIRKYYHPYDNQVTLLKKAEPAIRYAEPLLIYAEALNELTKEYAIPSYTGQGTVTVSRTKEEISRGLRPVRVRAGLTDFTDTYFDSKEEMRIRIKREWQIEFMAEAHRYYDLRRWGDAEREESMPVWGYNMDMTGPLGFEDDDKKQRDLWHTPHEISIIPAIFSEKMYLWPISQDELKKNRKLTQNPGWKTFEE
jgi:hypothetical protein